MARVPEQPIRRRSEGRRTNCVTFLKLWGKRREGEGAKRTSEGMAGEKGRREKKIPRKTRKRDFFARRNLFVPADFFSPVSFLVTSPYCWKLYACPVRRRCSSSFILDFSSGLSLWTFHGTPYQILHQRLEIEGDIKAWDLGTRRGSALNCSKSI